jgi:hypothetical protein
MKKLLFIALVAFGFASKAQTVTPVAGNINVQVNPNGVFLINGVVKGTVGNNLIKDPSNVTIGSYLNDGTIKNANNVIVGYFKDNYDVTDANNVVMGHLRTNLDVKTVANVVIGTYIDTTPPIYNAVAHFFILP